MILHIALFCNFAILGRRNSEESRMQQSEPRLVWFDLTFSCADLLTYYRVSWRAGDGWDWIKWHGNSVTLLLLLLLQQHNPMERRRSECVMRQHWQTEAMHKLKFKYVFIIWNTESGNRSSNSSSSHCVASQQYKQLVFNFNECIMPLDCLSTNS